MEHLKFKLETQIRSLIFFQPDEELSRELRNLKREVIFNFK